MANEIYHRSNWGNAVNDIYWADVYEKYSATNKMYIRSDYYENSNVTDKLMADIYPKPSILLTPTAYDNGKLNSVKPVGGENLLVQSNQFDTTWVNNTGGSIVGGQEGYDGSNNAWELNKSADSYRRIQQSINLSGIWTFSVYAKEGSLSTINLRDETNAIRVEFDLSNGTVSQNFGAIETNVENIGNGWYRCSATYDRTCTRVQIYVGWNQTTAGNVYIQNAQVEKGLKANTYIETTTTAKANGDFNFSRGSSATRVNEKGLIEDVQILSGNLVLNSDFSEEGEELVLNGDFSDGSNNWTVQSGTVNITDEAEFVGSSILRTINSPLTSGKLYKITYEITSITGSPVFKLYDGSWFTAPSTVGTHIVYRTINTTTFYLRNQSSDDLTIDNVSVKEVGQNWSFGTGWNMGDGKAVFSGTDFANLQPSSSLLTIGKKYKLSLTAEVTNGSFKVQHPSSSDLIEESNSGSYSAIFVATANTFTIARASVGVQNDFSIDNVSVIEITDDTNLPRINYTNGEGSLLLEPQSTNLVTYSEDFSQWSGNEITTQTGFLAPDGSNNAIKITSTGSQSYFVLSGLNLTGTDTRTIYAKTVSGTGTVNLCSYGQNTNNNFTITTQWQRFEVNGTTTATGEPNFYGVDFRFAEANPLSELIIWGAQSEALSYATSYIPTEGSTVTRLHDVPTYLNISNFVDSTYAIYFDYKDATRGTIGNTANFNYLYNQNNELLVYVYGTTLMLHSTTGEDYTSFDFNDGKIAINYDGTNVKYYRNGILIKTITASTRWQTSAGNYYLYRVSSNSKISYNSFGVFEALDNDQLERLTGEGYETFNLLAQANNYTII